MAVQHTGIPFWLKILYTAFLAVLVPVYWRDYGPTNFLYFCDIALFFALAAVWLEHPLLASAPAVGILIPQAIWIVDFLGGLIGFFPVGMTRYMFEGDRPLFTRGLSTFHFWLPLLLLWLVWRMGYDRRALALWTVLAWGVLWICYQHMPPPPAPEHNKNLPVNINYVFGLSEKERQTWMDSNYWIAGMMIGLPLFVYLPSHFFLAWVGKRRT